ncbi:hypothetical protein BLOT_012366 [Blomia tropicalis]|nr:hypothetical protein BLOT_012366 [Blomia tropicalis]
MDMDDDVGGGDGGGDGTIANKLIPNGTCEMKILYTQMKHLNDNYISEIYIYIVTELAFALLQF